MADKSNGNGKDTSQATEDKRLTVTWDETGAFNAQWSPNVGTSDLLAFSKWVEVYVNTLYSRQVQRSMEAKGAG